MATGGSFVFPYFYAYPPFFTLQPIKDTRDKQIALWCSLILGYCQSCKLFIIDVQDESLPIFSNPAINRKLSTEAKVAFLDDLVGQARAEWLDKGKRQCLILWKRVDEWAGTIHNFVKTYGLSDSVMTVDELSGGDDVRGTELHGINKDLLVRALKVLEVQGKVRLFKGATPEELGAKFL